MIDCIQRSYKKNAFQHKLPNKENVFKLKLKGTRQIYNKLVLENNFKESYKLKWQVIMQKEYDQHDWIFISNITFKCTTIPGNS